MPALNFPSSPSVGQVYSQGLLSWVWNGISWDPESSLATATTFSIGEVVQSATAPTGGTWLQTNKYYSKAAYPALASALGSVPDIGSPVVAAKAQIPQTCVFNNSNSRPHYYMATNGTSYVFASYTSMKFLHTTDGTKYTAVPPNASISAIQGIFYVNGLYIAPTSSGTTSAGLLVSSDGLDWSAKNIRQLYNQTTNCIAYGAGVYVVAYQSGLIYSSSLDSQFTSGTGYSGTNYQKVIYAGGQFVAVGFAGALATSPDGINWTPRTATGISSFTDVIYSSEKSLYIAYGISSSYGCFTSSDGVTWTAITAFQYANVNNIIYDGTQFIAATNVSIYVSTDGLTWNARSIPTVIGSQIGTVSYVNGTYYLGMTQNGYYLTSSDSTTWTLKRDFCGSSLPAIFNVNNKAVATGQAGITVLAGGTREAYEPVTSFTVANVSTGGARQIAYNGTDQFVAISSTGLPITSPDGQSWAGQPLPGGITMTTGTGISYLGNTYVIYGSNSTKGIFTSTDGTNWEARTTSVIGTAAATNDSGTTYVVVGTLGGITSSNDSGVTWTTRTNTGTSTFNDIIFGNGVFIAVNATGAVYRSADGTTWTGASAGASPLTRVIWVGGTINLFFALGSSGAIYTSPTGETWTLATGTGTNQFVDIVYNNTSGMVVAVGASSRIYTTTNGTTWTNRSLGDTSYTLGIITWDGTRYITMPINNASHAAFRSSDGITWTRTHIPMIQGIRLQWIGGKYILICNSNAIYYSNDSLTWNRSPQSPMRGAGNLTTLQKVGNVYYAFGTFQSQYFVYTSTDGITFTPNRSSLYSGLVAYDGTYYYSTVKWASGSVVVYRSSNGIDWAYLTDLGTTISSTNQLGGFSDILYANGKLVGFTSSYPLASTTETSSVYYSTDGIAWTPGGSPTGGYPGTLSYSGVGTMATNGTALIAPFTTTSTSYGMYKSTDSGATWSSFFGSTFGPIIYTGNYWYWQSFKTADGSTVSGGPTNTLTAVGSYNGYTFNIFGTSAALWKTSGNNNVSSFSYKISTPGAYSLVASPKEVPIRSSDNTVLTMANSGSLPATMANSIAEYPLFSYDTATTFFVPQQNAAVASNEYIYAGA